MSVLWISKGGPGSGDKVGHEFHGNQHTNGGSMSDGEIHEMGAHGNKYGTDHKLVRDGGAWGYSHENSRQITHSASRVMGIEGYESLLGADTAKSDAVAEKFLSAIASDKVGSGEVLYHGFSQSNPSYAVGDTLKLPLVATSWSDGTALGFADSLGKDSVIFKFELGTPIAGYSRTSLKNPDYEEGEGFWEEALASGEFEVVHVETKQRPYSTWLSRPPNWEVKENRPTVHTVTLRAKAIFDPVSKTWKKIKRAG